MPGFLDRIKNKKLKGVDVDANAHINARATTAGDMNLNIFPNAHIKFGDALIKKAALERTNQLESRRIAEDFSTELQTLLDNSDFERLRKVASKRVFSEGLLWLFPVPANGTYILDLWRVIDRNKVGSIYHSIDFATSTSIILSGNEVNLNAKVVLLGNQAKLEYYYEALSAESSEIQMISYGEAHIFDNITRIPGAPFRSNFEEEGEVQRAGLTNAIEYLNYVSQAAAEESMKTRTMYELNQNFTDHDKKSFEKILREGYSSFETESYNQKLQNGVSIPVSGSQATTLTQLAFAFVEDKFKEYMGVLRDSTSTGAQKHTLEITLQNQTATETLWSIKEVREIDYKALVRSLCEVLRIADESEKVSLKLSIIEEMKIKNMEETLAAKENKGTMSKDRRKEGE